MTKKESEILFMEKIKTLMRYNISPEDFWQYVHGHIWDMISVINDQGHIGKMNKDSDEV